mgnify:CR=1 FL=1
MNKRQQIEKQLAALSNRRSPIAMALQQALDSLPPDEPTPEPKRKATSAKKKTAARKSPSVTPPAESENAKAELTLSELENSKTELSPPELENAKAEPIPVTAESQPTAASTPKKTQDYTPLGLNPKGFFYQAIAELPGQLMEEEGQLFLKHGAAQILLYAKPDMVERLKGHIGDKLTVAGWPSHNGERLVVRQMSVLKPKERPVVMLAGLVKGKEDGLDLLVPRNAPRLTKKFVFFHLSAPDLDLRSDVRFVRCYASYGPDGKLKLSGITKASHHVPRYRLEEKESP